MTDKAPPVGWVVQVTIPAPLSSTKATGARWIGPSLLGAPSFKYFNVAIAAPNKAIEAAAKHFAEGKDREMSVVRGLSSAEIAALRLEAGQVKPA